MKFTILGSWWREGSPAIFNNFFQHFDWKDITSKNFRTRPWFLVENNWESFLIEIGPDIRLQTIKNKIQDIQNFLISHRHFDHMYGLYELDAWSTATHQGNITLYGSPRTTERLENNFAHISKRISTLLPYKTFELAGVEITPLPVYHMRSEDDKLDEENLANTYGYLLECEWKKIAYLADYYKLPDKVVDLIEGADWVIADGTYLFEEDFIDHPVANLVKKDMDHIHGNAILDLMKDINAKQIVFHSITPYTNKSHDDLQAMLPKNYYIAYDGMKLS